MSNRNPPIKERLMFLRHLTNSVPGFWEGLQDDPEAWIRDREIVDGWLLDLVRDGIRDDDFGVGFSRERHPQFWPDLESFEPALARPYPLPNEFEYLDLFHNRMTNEFNRSLDRYIRNFRTSWDVDTLENADRDAMMTAVVFAGAGSLAELARQLPGPDRDHESTVRKAVKGFSKRIGLTMPSKTWE